MRLVGSRKYPREIMIGTELWDVKFVRKIDHHNSLGLCDPSLKTIFIKLGQDKENTLSTFIHEVIHAFEFEYEFDLKHAHVYKLEEAILNFITVNL